MLKRVKPWLWILSGALASRLISMALFPLVDTTEPRYAEIARLMVETGDWITPWFTSGVPFWGKPPLSFWLQAASIQSFGLSEFTLRLPAWFANLGIVYLTWRFARELFGDRTARWSAIVFATTSLAFISAGAVMTDPFLTLGTTISLVSFGMVVNGHERGWRWSFFLGLCIGLLAKGLLTLALTGLPIALWLLTTRYRPGVLRAFPWIGGSLLTLVLTLPWYIAAELKTPGFLDYFIIGEHIQRFLDPGWTGDLYGTAHQHPRGMIWIFWVWASFPWGLIGLLAGLVLAVRPRGRLLLHGEFRAPNTRFVILCALSPMLFFTLASNTLWTYVLPALPFSAVLVARVLLMLAPSRTGIRRIMIPATLLVPLLTVGVLLLVQADFSKVKTESGFANYYATARQPGDSHLLYLEDLPFSARFYSGGKALEVSMEELSKMRQNHEYRRYFLAVPNNRAHRLLNRLPPSTKLHGRNLRYSLLSFTDPATNTQG